MMGGSEDRHERNVVTAIRFAIITVSDTRTANTDITGRTVEAIIRAAGFEVVDKRIVRNDARQIKDTVRKLSRAADCIITTGGTGVSSRDLTVAAIRELSDKEVVGFGQLFRQLSYRQIGARAMLSNAACMLVEDCVVFLLPGSPRGAELAMNEIIIPVIPHMLWELRR